MRLLLLLVLCTCGFPDADDPCHDFLLSSSSIVKCPHPEQRLEVEGKRVICYCPREEPPATKGPYP